MIWRSHSYEYVCSKPDSEETHANVYYSTIYNSQVMETTEMPTDRWMDKELTRAQDQT